MDVPSRQVGVAIVGKIHRRGSGEQSFHRHLLAELPLDCALRCATQQNDPALHRALNFLVLADFYFIRSTLRGNTRIWIGLVFDNV